MRRYQLFIDGQWTDSSDSQWEPNTNPANVDDVVGEFASATADDVKAAVDAANRAFPAWRGDADGQTRRYSVQSGESAGSPVG